VRAPVVAAAVILAALAGAAATFALRSGAGGGVAAAIDDLRLRLDAERTARERLEDQLARLQSDLLALHLAAEVVSEAEVAPYLGAGEAGAGGAAEPPVDPDAAEDSAPGQAWFDVARLDASGMPERDVDDLRRLFEEVELERLYVQNQATRERWDRSRLAEELAALAGAAATFALRGGAAAALDDLRLRLDAERAARERLEDQLARLESDLLALHLAAEVVSEAEVAPYLGAGEGGAGGAAEPPVDPDAAEDSAPGQAWFDAARLDASGMPERDVEDLRRLFEEVELERLYVQNQATRESWDRRRLAEELTALGERTRSVRETYGDETYDWFLYAADRTNRVRVESVLGGSAADEAGLRAGDVILSYDGSRIFKPGSLVRGTLQGRLGDRVEVIVQRGGSTHTVNVPVGPLGIRLGRATVEPTPLP